MSRSMARSLPVLPVVVCRLVLAMALMAPNASGAVVAAPAAQTLEPPTPTATETVASTATDIVAETATGTVTETATLALSETPTGTPTGTPPFTETPATETPTLEPPATLTPEPSPTATPASESVGPMLQLALAASPEQVTPGSDATFTLTITNDTDATFTDVVFSDSLPADFGESKAGFGELKFDPATRALTWTAKEILPKTTVTLQYTITVSAEAEQRNSLPPPLYLTDTALLTATEMKEPVKALATLLVTKADESLNNAAPTGGSAKGLNDKIQINVPPGAITTGGAHALLVKDLSAAHPPAEGQLWQAFELQLLGDPLAADIAEGRATPPPDPDVTIAESDERISLQPVVEAKFEKPVELTVSFDSLTNLAELSAEYKPFLVTLDEVSGVWVDVPIRLNREANTITAETTHFSTWGAGVGASFPNNSANIILFDSAEPELFTGRSHFSIPIWTPPGRAGMAPSLSLGYTSGMADGVLGDVQAPWTGMGWSVDTVEITRKITNGACSPCGSGSGGTGYGYRDEYILTFNGIGGKLTPEVNNPKRYHTKDESFVYVERHNVALGNHQSGGINPPNAGDEWWEVVAKDGTRWRLGWNADSEQLAAMKGYPGTNSGAWAALGYAGAANDVVALRWRADRVTDTHGNTMTFNYFEETRVVAGTANNYDRASYLDYVSYSGHTSGTPAPQYWAEFVRAARTSDIPASPKEFDNWDTLLLDKINVKYGAALATATIVRTYDLAQGFQSGSYVNVLQSVVISGPLNGGATAPTASFTYGNFNNIFGAIPYPRLVIAYNGWGGSTTFTYDHDGRTGANTWLNWRVIATSTGDGVSGQFMPASYAYLNPCYNDDPVNGGGTGWCNPGNIGDLVGYGQTTVTSKDFNGTTVLGITVHKFHSDEQKAGQAYEVQDKDAAGTILSQTNTEYTVLSNDLPAQTYFPYVSAVENKVRQNGALTFVNRTEYEYDPNTGNLVSQKDYDAPGPALTFSEDYEPAPHDLSRWSSSVTNGGTLSVTTASHLNGAWGMQAVIDNTMFVESGEQVVMEAEKYTSETAGTGTASGSDWQSTTGLSGYQGSSAMQALPDSGVNTSLSTNGPALNYKINFTNTGLYYVYIRG